MISAGIFGGGGSNYPNREMVSLRQGRFATLTGDVTVDLKRLFQVVGPAVACCAASWCFS